MDKRIIGNIAAAGWNAKDMGMPKEESLYQDPVASYWWMQGWKQTKQAKQNINAYLKWNKKLC